MNIIFKSAAPLFTYVLPWKHHKYSHTQNTGYEYYIQD